MLERKVLFPHVIELNFQAGQVFGCNVYVVFDKQEWMLLDIGYDDTVEEIVELIRQLDFPLAHCKGILVTHPDVDHAQGLARAKRLLRTRVLAHPEAATLLARGDKLLTFAEVVAQDIHLDFPAVTVDQVLSDGDHLAIGDQVLEVWYTPGHTHNHLAFRLGDLLFSGDNIYRDGCVGAIDAHHGSNLTEFIHSLQRIRASEVTWLLPSHGPIFRKQDALLDATITRLGRYQQMADFGTCAVHWPLMDEWEQEIAAGKRPI